MAYTPKILAFAGSTRKESFNKKLVKIAADAARAAGAQVTFLDLRDIPMPLYDGDLEAEQGIPENAKKLKALLLAHDGLLISAPEYNSSISGVLKNAIDWASRPYGDNAWDGKPVAMMGASVGAMGTARAQYHLRQVFVFLNMYPLNRPEVMIANASQRFDEKGNLTDDDTKTHIQKLLVALVAWAKHHEGGRRAAAASE